MSVTPQRVLEFWIDEVGPKGWYVSEQALDDEIRAEFGATVAAAAAGGIETWRRTPEGVLAYLIVCDQFPRNIHRGKADSFAADTRARTAAGAAVAKDWDLEIAPPQRQFCYMPFVHSECMADQDRGVWLMKSRMSGSEGGDSNLMHARAHREIIRKFSRFPFRNAALGRTSSDAETAFMKDGGYMALVKEIEARA